MKKIVLLCASILGLVGVSNADIVARADAWCPYNCEPGSKPGYLVEVLNKALPGVDYGLMSWDETLEAAKAGSIDVAIGASYKEAPELLYPTESTGSVQSSVIVKKGKKVDVKNVESLKPMKIGYVDGYYYSEKVNAYLDSPGANVVAISGDNVTEDLVMSLINGKVDAIIEDANVADYMIVGKGYTGMFDYFSLNETSPVSFGFSPKNPKSKEYVAAVDKTVREMKTNGEWTKLLKKYGVKE